MKRKEPSDAGADRWRACTDPRAAPRIGTRTENRLSLDRPLVVERRHSDAFDSRHRPMKDHILAADFLRKHDAILVVACDTRSVSPVTLRIEKVISGDQADTRASG